MSPSTFTLQSAELQANEFRWSRSGTLRDKKIEEMQIKWNIPKSNNHIVLHNIADNVKKKAMDKIYT